MNMHPMAVALRALITGPALVKLREKTSQPLSVPTNEKDSITTVVDEHISLEAKSWTEIGDGAAFKFTLINGGMDVTVAVEDIFAVFTKTSELS